DVFGLKCSRYQGESASVVGVASESLLHFLEQALRFRKGRSRDAGVPLVVLQGSEATQREFLRGYFAGDGGLMNRKSGLPAATSASEELLRTVQVMLLNFGVVSRRKPTQSYATNGSSIRRSYWRLTIAGQ